MTPTLMCRPRAVRSLKINLYTIVANFWRLEIAIVLVTPNGNSDSDVLPGTIPVARDVIDLQLTIDTLPITVLVAQAFHSDIVQ